MSMGGRALSMLVGSFFDGAFDWMVIASGWSRCQRIPNRLIVFV